MNHKIYIYRTGLNTIKENQSKHQIYDGESGSLSNFNCHPIVCCRKMKNKKKPQTMCQWVSFSKLSGSTAHHNPLGHHNTCPLTQKGSFRPQDRFLNIILTQTTHQKTRTNTPHTHTHTQMRFHTQTLTHSYTHSKHVCVCVCICVFWMYS